MNHPLQPGRIKHSSASSEFRQIQRWADTRGVQVVSRTKAGKTVYAVTWWEIGSHWRTTEIEDLTELPRYINGLIESGQTPRPGVFYVHWQAGHLPPSHWCRTRSWILVIVVEGVPPRKDRESTGGGSDPTPYPSAQEAVDSIAFLGRERGARPKFYASVFDIKQHEEQIPTASYSQEAVEEQIREIVRYCAYQRLRLYHRNDVDYVAQELMDLGLPREQGMQAVQRMITEGRLIRDCQYERTEWKRRFRRLQNWRRVCFAEPGWECRLIPCEKCEGAGKTLTNERSMWMVNPWRPDHYDSSEDTPSIDRCPRCRGEGKVGQWRQK